MGLVGPVVDVRVCCPYLLSIRVVLPLGSRGSDEMGGKCPSKWVWSLSIFHIFLYETDELGFKKFSCIIFISFQSLCPGSKVLTLEELVSSGMFLLGFHPSPYGGQPQRGSTVVAPPGGCPRKLFLLPTFSFCLRERSLVPLTFGVLSSCHSILTHSFSHYTCVLISSFPFSSNFCSLNS